MNSKNITGIILAGGKSSRMGSDKGLIELDGKKFIEHILAALVPNVDEVIIIANNSNYNALGYKVFPDIIKDHGPLGGIYTGLMNTKTENNVVISCDTPFINSGLINYIIENKGEADICIPVFKGDTQPLCAIYSKKIVGGLHKLLQENELKIHNMLKHFIIKEIPITDKLTFYTDRLLTNINTPEELKQQKEASA